MEKKWRNKMEKGLTTKRIKEIVNKMKKLALKVKCIKCGTRKKLYKVIWIEPYSGKDIWVCKKHYKPEILMKYIKNAGGEK